MKNLMRLLGRNKNMRDKRKCEEKKKIVLIQEK